MKKLLHFLILTIIASACCSKTESLPPVVNQKEEQDKVAIVLEKYVIANETQDIKMAREIWASEPDIYVFGTNSDEQIVGWDAIQVALQRQFDTFHDTYISVQNQVITINSTANTAWFSETLNYNYIYQGKALQYEGLRFTGVLSKINDDWFIVQSHVSIPASPQ